MTFNAAVLSEVAADPMAAVRALNRMTRAGFALALEEGRLMVEPLSQLNEQQRAYIRAHKAALVALLLDAEVVYRALALAGPAGLGWMEGTPAGWDGVRLLAAGEVLYVTRRMVSRDGRRYAREHAPPPPPFREYRVPDISPGTPPRIGPDPLEMAQDTPPDISPPLNVIPLEKALALTIRDSAESMRGVSP